MSNDKRVTKTNDEYVVELFARMNTNSKIEDEAEGVSILEPAKSLVEDEQYSVYKEIVDNMEERPIIIKTPKLEKEITVLKTQLRAMLRVAVDGDVSIMFPQIASITQLREYKDILEECKKELDEENTPYKKRIKIGIVVEIPSAALMSYELGKECDFFFIETNSLTNYTFGEKQNNKKVSEQYIEYQPVIIKLIQQAIQGAHDAGIFCGISGEIAENKLYMPLLIGLGLDQFSIDSKNIEDTRIFIHELDKSECKYLVEEIMQIRTIEEIEYKLKKFARN